MDTKIHCYKCNQYSFIRLNDYDELKSVDAKFCCTDCRLILELNNSTASNLSNTANSSSSNCINLYKQNIFYYFDNPTLYETSKYKNDNDKSNLFEIYAQKIVLLVGVGPSRKLDLLKSLRSLPVKALICLCNENQSWSYDHFDDWIIAEHENVDEKEKTLKTLETYIQTRNIKFDAIITYSDFCVLMTSYLAKCLNLPAMPYEIADKAKNKYEFRNLCKELNINCPKYFELKSGDRQEYLNRLKNESTSLSLKSFTNEVIIPYPIIIKNPNGTGKDFVKKCKSNQDLADALNDSLILYKEIDLLIEEFYEGHEIDIDILIQNNETKFLVISDNFPPIEPYFFEQGGMTPSIHLSSEEKEAIEYLLKKWLGKLNLQNACLHFEAKCKPKSIYKDVNMFDENSNLIDESNFLMPIEINLRIGGAETWSMIKAAYDVDLMQEVLNIGLGIELNKDLLYFKAINPTNQCISKDFHPAKNVLIKSIKFDKDLFKNKELVELAISRCVGEKLKPKDFLGWLTVKCEKNSSFELLKNKQSELLKHIHFEFENY